MPGKTPGLARGVGREGKGTPGFLAFFVGSHGQNLNLIFTRPKTNGWNPRIAGLGRCFSFSKGVCFFVPCWFSGVYIPSLSTGIAVGWGGW